MKSSKRLLIAISTLSLLACGLFTIPDEPAIAVETEPAITEQIAPAEPTSPPTLADPPATRIGYGSIARTHLEALTAIGARAPGSENESLAAEYIDAAFHEMGYVPEIQDFRVEGSNIGGYSSQNVIAVKTGYSPIEIIIGAHYDSSDEGLGTDDNASGVAVMLETAKLLAEMTTPYTIRFIAFGSEETDLDGSRFYAKNMAESEVNNTLVMINLDSLAAGDITYVYSEEGEDAFLREWVLDWAENQRVPMQTILDVELAEDGSYYSDFGNFKDQGIPFIYFEATNWTLGDLDGWTQMDPTYGDEGYIWHTPFDNLEYLDATFPGRVDENMNIFVSALIAITTQYHE